MFRPVVTRLEAFGTHSREIKIKIWYSWRLTISPSRNGDKKFVPPDFYSYRKWIFGNEVTHFDSHLSASFVRVSKVHWTPRISFEKGSTSKLCSLRYSPSLNFFTWFDEDQEQGQKCQKSPTALTSRRNSSIISHCFL